MSNRPDLAYYYPAPFWGPQDSGWVKSLLLFFDKVGILLPDYMSGQHQAADPALTEPLEDLGLLEVLEPNTWVDQEMTNTLAEIIVELLTNGTFDDLPETDYFHELSQSRIGYSADFDLADFLVAELKAKGLARPSEDGVSIPLHPAVRTTILVILAQLSRLAGGKHGFTVHPATSDHYAATELIETLSRERMPSRDKVVALDLESVSFDMDLIPLDDVLQFRKEHRQAHRSYIRDLRGFMAELAGIEIRQEREALLMERRQEIADAAHELQGSTRRAIGKNLPSMSLGLVGGAWSLASLDPIGAALAAVSLIPGFIDNSETVTAYSYLHGILISL